MWFYSLSKLTCNYWSLLLLLKTTAFSCQGQQFTCTTLSQWFIPRKGIHLSLPYNIMLAHCIDNVILMMPGNQEVATILDVLVRHLHVRRRKINLTNFWRPSTSVIFLGVQWSGACQDTLFKVRNKLSHLAPHMAQMRHAWCATPTYLVIKNYIFVWDNSWILHF